MSARDAGWYRKIYQDISGSLVFINTTDDTTLVTVRDSRHALYIQEIIVYITTDAAQSLIFEDSNDYEIFQVTTSPGDSTVWRFNGGDEGVKLGTGYNFRVDMSAVGLAGTIRWYGYQKLITAGAPIV